MYFMKTLETTTTPRHRHTTLSAYSTVRTKKQEGITSDRGLYFVSNHLNTMNRRNKCYLRTRAGCYADHGVHGVIHSQSFRSIYRSLIITSIDLDPGRFECFLLSKSTNDLQSCGRKRRRLESSLETRESQLAMSLEGSCSSYRFSTDQHRSDPRSSRTSFEYNPIERDDPARVDIDDPLESGFVRPI